MATFHVLVALLVGTCAEHVLDVTAVLTEDEASRACLEAAKVEIARAPDKDKQRTQMTHVFRNQATVRCLSPPAACAESVAVRPISIWLISTVSPACGHCEDRRGHSSIDIIEIS